MKSIMFRERVFNVKLVTQQLIDMSIAHISEVDKARWTLIEYLKKKSSVIFRVMTNCDVARPLTTANQSRKSAWSLSYGHCASSQWKWKNFFYRRQEAGKDQVNFWVGTYPEDEPWLVRGIHAPGRDEFPFNAEPPVARQDQTIGDRLNWVIEEFAAPRGEQLFTYLAGRYGRGIIADDWRKVILRKAEPTLEMVALVCSDRPMFTEWVLLGRASSVAVDPTDKASVERWKNHRLAEREKLARLVDQKP